jgi:hypothetical protein
VLTARLAAPAMLRHLLRRLPACLPDPLTLPPRILSPCPHLFQKLDKLLANIRHLLPQALGTPAARALGAVIRQLLVQVSEEIL